MLHSSILVQHLQKSFMDSKKIETKVLKDVNFEVKQGEIFALLGSNGAGKTTIVNILSTLLDAASGTVTICGFDVMKQPEKVRECISLTGQFAAIDEILTGRENLILIAKLRNIKNPDIVVDALLQQFDLVVAANKRAGTYSGGMKRKLDIAMSLIGSPKVIFLDEPTTGLDPEARIEVWETIKTLANQGTTILLTTQYLEEAEQLADRIAILHEGKMIAEGTLQELKKLFPPVKKEYIEKQPSLEEIFLAIITQKEEL